MRLRTAALAGLIALSACAGERAYQHALDTNTIEAWRAYLGEASPGLVEPATQRLSELEFAEARRLNTALAYRRFLDEFAESARASEAETLLENLRFADAAQRGTAAAWQEFLLDHPRGRKAEEARRLEADRALAEARTSGDAAALAAFARRYPAHPAAAEASAAGDDAIFAKARERGAEALSGYLEAFASGKNRDEAHRLLRAAEVDAMLSLDAIASARDAARRAPDDATRAALLRRVDDAEVARLALAFEPALLEELAGRLGAGPAAERARAEAAALRKLGKEGERLRALALALDPAAGAPTVEVLVAQLVGASDAHARAEAAVRLGASAGPAAIDPLLTSSTDATFLVVRRAARLALQALVEALPEPGRAYELGIRTAMLRPIAKDGATLTRLGLLERLRGDARAAEESFARAAREAPEDPLVQLELAELRAQRKERFAAAVAARLGARAAARLADERWAGTKAGGAPLLSTTRQLCGSAEVLRRAAPLLSAAGASGSDPDDPAEFAEEAAAISLRLRERLAEAEANLLADAPTTPRCGASEAVEALAIGAAGRERAIAAIQAPIDGRTQALLRRVAATDPAEPVRRRAAERLAGR